MNTSSIVDALNHQYQAVISLPEKAFFVGAANYIKAILENNDLVDVQSELAQKALSDYDETIEAIGKHETGQSDHKKWKMADFIKAGRSLGEKHKMIKAVLGKEEVDVSHAWMRLRSLEMMLHDREQAKRVYSKTPRGMHEYEVSIKELDVILSTSENAEGNSEYEFWVESGRKKSLKEIPRSIFIHEEYLNYLAQVHMYFMAKMPTMKASSRVSFPDGETVIYQNKSLSFKLGDGSHLPVDFSTSPDLRRVFETFWELRRRTPKMGVSLVTALQTYKELFGDDIDGHTFVTRISHIRRTKINKKPELKERFKIEFDKTNKTWFLILS